MEKAVRTHRQKGVILVIALVLMVAMALTAVAAYRMSGADELINSNTRARAITMQAAQAAMNFCKRSVFAGKLSVASTPPGEDPNTYTGTRWQAGTWNGAGVNAVSHDQLGWEYRNAADGIRPMCMVEDITQYVEFNSTSEVPGHRSAAYRITVRAFSPNFRLDAHGLPISGAQVWIQVVVGRVLG